MNNLISVCIATYKRPLLLEKLLVSLLNQKNIDEFNLEIIVVDNDPNRTAEPVINKFKELIVSNYRYSVKYDMQPEKNIALTRNKTVELATGNYLYFIDDDEYADEYCIYNHLKVMKEFDADVTFGNVFPYFDNDVSEVIKSAYLFYQLNNIDGKLTSFYSTSNACIHLSGIKKTYINFNVEFGLTGGEDVELFSRLKKYGYKLISASSARVYENVPKTRTNILWLFKRAFRTGNDYTRITIKNKGRFLIYIKQFFRGIIQGLAAFFLSLFFLPVNKIKSFNWFLKAASNFGKPFAVLGVHPKEYK